MLLSDFDEAGVKDWLWTGRCRMGALELRHDGFLFPCKAYYIDQPIVSLSTSPTSPLRKLVVTTSIGPVFQTTSLVTGTSAPVTTRLGSTRTLLQLLPSLAASSTVSRCSGAPGSCGFAGFLVLRIQLCGR